jgi:acetolactate decarboxylase
MGTIWQNAPSISLESGCFDGISTVAEVKQQGDLGIGAFDQLDGELTAVDGVFYRVLADASAHAATDADTLPFCMVTRFNATETYPLPSDISEEALAAFMDDRLGTKSYFYSLRVDGVFSDLHTRCFPKQKKPYPTLKEVMATQPTFSYERLEGTMVGFRAPSYVGNMTPPGYHLHLISADRTVGGHVMSFDGADATISAERIDRHEIDYPGTRDFETKNLG